MLIIMVQIFPCVGKFFPVSEPNSVFSLSGKSKNQVPCFPCAVVTLEFFASGPKLIMGRVSDGDPLPWTEALIPWTETPLDQDPLDRDPYSKEQVVNILMEWILVIIYVMELFRNIQRLQDSRGYG